MRGAYLHGTLFRRGLMAGVALAAMAVSLFPAEALAQSDAGAVETVVVTGTRIQRPNLKSDSPITSVNAKDIKISGISEIETALNRLPQFTADANENVSNGSDGTANINLRGLGSNRDLVLIDGQRMLPTLAVDLNFIPSAMIERVDVLTGGASAVYGSDAISGVVNFVLNKHLNGVRIDAQTSIYQHNNDNTMLRSIQRSQGDATAKNNVWDGSKYYINMAAGGDIDGGRGNVSAYIGYRSVAPVTQDTRDYSACTLSDAGATFTCGGSGNQAFGRFDPLTGPNAGADYSNAKDGSKTWVPMNSSFLYNYASTNYIQRQDDRITSGAFAHYKVTSWAEAYASFMYMNDHTFSQAAPSAIWLGTNFTINCDNPFMSDQQKTLLCGSTTSTADAHALIGYRMANGAPRRDDLRHQDYRGQLGVRGSLTDNIAYDVSWTKAQMVFDENYQNDVNQAAAAKAVQAVSVSGVPTCKSVIDGSDPACVPIDIFSAAGPSQAGYQYIYQNTFTHGEQSMSDLMATLNADLGGYGLTSPWASDGVAAVLGFEGRDESLLFKADALAQAAGTNNADGHISSKEIFSEIDIPLVQDKPGIKSLGINAGFRYTMYDSHSMAVTSKQKTFSTWKIEGNYAPSDDIRFRAGFNRAVRAPNISELFASQGLGNVAGQDPCSGSSPTASLASCQLSGVTSGEYGHITECPADVCVQQYGGNPNLDPETAKTITAGFVLTPSFVDDLQVSVDYFSIKINHYISTVDPQLVISQCVTSGNPFFCSLIHRDHASGGILFGTNGYVVSTNVNTGYLDTSGVDIGADYRFDVGSWGGLSFDMLGTYLSSMKTQPLPGLGSYDCKGLFGPTCGQPQPTWRHSLRTTWTLPDIAATVSLNWRYLGGVSLSSNTTNPYLAGRTSVINAKIPAYNYFDLAGTYDVGHGILLTGGINNIFDKSPPAIDQGLLSSFGNGNTYPGVYDPMGRMFFMNLTAKY